MNTNHYSNLLVQAEKLYRHNRQGSYKTKERYFEAYKRFLRYLGDVWHLEKLQNISGKHLSGYVAYMKGKHYAASTIKTDLAAIRFWQDQIPNAKYTLPPNDAFDLERRKFSGVDRTWSDGEYNRMILQCWNAKRDDYAACIVIARYAGLRLHEVMRIDTAIARAALKNGFITVKGKGGKVRDVPITDSIRIVLEKFLKLTPPGHKLFVPDGKPTHIAKTELQNFINAHRQFVTGPNAEKPPITFHGLRHTCAAAWYQKLIRGGKTEYEARVQVSKWLGHERDDVTRIYLAAIPPADKPNDDPKGGGENV